MDLPTIKHDVNHCDKCPLAAQLPCKGTFKPQHGLGSKDAKLMIITLKPTYDAHLMEKPLDAKCELLIKKLVSDSNIESHDIFITNVVKCKCTVSQKSLKSYGKICISHLQNEINCIQPQFYIYFGINSHYIATGIKSPITSLTNNHNVYITHSLEELYRHGIAYYNHALCCMKEIKERLK